MIRANIVAQGLYFGEGPRWHEGRLWFSDFYEFAVKSLAADGEIRVEVRLDDQPSGLGWLPDGRLLVVSMQAQKLLRLDPGGLVMHADLSGLAENLCNDMAVDGLGRAWVGNFGFDLDAQVEARGVESVIVNHPTASLIRVEPNGAVHLASAEMHFPNGTVVTPDGKTLIVAETLAFCLTAFDIGDDGTLSNRRQWASVGSRAPDGICLDEEGNIWTANALAPECVLVAPGGDILATVETSQNCYACMLGGERGRDLYLLTAQSSDKNEASGERNGKIEVARVDAARAGWP